ncbi:hypothetical protein BO443_210001 [Burkholderia orbicola]
MPILVTSMKLLLGIVSLVQAMGVGKERWRLIGAGGRSIFVATMFGLVLPSTAAICTAHRLMCGCSRFRRIH